MKISQVQIIPLPKSISGTGEKVTIKNCVFSMYSPWNSYLESYKDSIFKICGMEIESGKGSW